MRAQVGAPSGKGEGGKRALHGHVRRGHTGHMPATFLERVRGAVCMRRKPKARKKLGRALFGGGWNGVQETETDYHAGLRYHNHQHFASTPASPEMAGTKRRANGAPSAAAGAGAGAGAATFRSGSRSLDAVASAAAAPSQLAEASTSRRRLNGMQEESSSGARNAEESDTEIGPGGSFSSANGGSSDDGGSDDFDDDVDLIAAATATRSGAASSNDDDDDDDEGREREPVSEEWDHAMYSDEDMEGGFEDVDGSRPADEAKEEGARSNRAGPPQGKKASLYAVPSRDEMNQLKNTSELYKSNIFKLKVRSKATQSIERGICMLTEKCSFRSNKCSLKFDPATKRVEPLTLSCGG